jgi:hypothetical protein
MAVDRIKIRVTAYLIKPDGAVDNYGMRSLLEQMANQLNGTWITEVDQLTTSISDPPTQAEVQEIGNKVNELIVAIQNGRLMDS